MHQKRNGGVSFWSFLWRAFRADKTFNFRVGPPDQKILYPPLWEIKTKMGQVQFYFQWPKFCTVQSWCHSECKITFLWDSLGIQKRVHWPRSNTEHFTRKGIELLQTEMCWRQKNCFIVYLIIQNPSSSGLLQLVCHKSPSMVRKHPFLDSSSRSNIVACWDAQRCCKQYALLSP